jgi:hypothetical protein
MIVSLSDETSGDLADANLHLPYKSETNVPRTPPAKALEQEGLGMYLTTVGGGLVALAAGPYVAPTATAPLRTGDRVGWTAQQLW